MRKIHVGELRPSQLLWTFGPGALVDLPNLSVITLGLEQWDTNHCAPIEEARLLEHVRRILGPQVQRLRMPPVSREETIDPFSPEAKIGVPVRPFPRWLRCVRCGLLASFESGLFEIREDHFRPDKTTFIHGTCEKGSHSDAAPARFLLACRAGHIDDFPWHYYVHGGAGGCRGTLRFFEVGASMQTENLWIKCDACGAARTLAAAFGRRGRSTLPACRGRHPHLDTYEECSEEPRTVLLGSTNSWFPVSISVLAIPTLGDSLLQLVSDGWTYFEEVSSKQEAEYVLKTLVKSNALPGIEDYEAARVWAAIQERSAGTSAALFGDVELKRPEWQVLTGPHPPSDWPHFLSERAEAPTGFGTLIQDVLVLSRLRQVNALVGYTRIDAPEGGSDPNEEMPMAAISLENPEWVPATEVHGEGVFIRFREPQIRAWERKDAVRLRERLLMAGYRGWRSARKRDPETDFPGVRYVMLHTLAHLLIREFALECGYNAASIRERLYATAEGEPMAGILLYTASSDSDGTLGGLADLGKPQNLQRMLEQALQRASICSSDPLCSEHEPERDRSLHAAACHACSFVSETSCERGNGYLDRTLLVPTYESSDAAFFGPEHS